MMQAGNTGTPDRYHSSYNDTVSSSGGVHAMQCTYSCWLIQVFRVLWWWPGVICCRLKAVLTWDDEIVGTNSITSYSVVGIKALLCVGGCCHWALGYCVYLHRPSYFFCCWTNAHPVYVTVIEKWSVIDYICRPLHSFRCQAESLEEGLN